MIVYSIIMFTAAIVFIVFAVLISKGKTNLINCYHEDRTPDKPTYCKKFSQSLWIFAAVLGTSGIVGLFGETDAVAVSAVVILLAGVICGLFRLFYVQKKHGGGLF